MADSPIFARRTGQSESGNYSVVPRIRVSGCFPQTFQPFNSLGRRAERESSFRTEFVRPA
jgi:hypothetical protein